MFTRNKGRKEINICSWVYHQCMLGLLRPSFNETGCRPDLCQPHSRRWSSGLTTEDKTLDCEGCSRVVIAGLWSIALCDFPSVPTHLRDLCPTSGEEVSTAEGCLTELTYNLHAGQVDSDFLETGKASSCVILPAMAVISSAPVIGAFCWVVQPKPWR